MEIIIKITYSKYNMNKIKPIYNVSHEDFCNICLKKNKQSIDIFTYFLLIENNYPEISNLLKMFKNKKKIKMLNEYVFKSPFIKQNIKDKILRIFCKAQKIYHAFSRFVFIYKFKKATYYDNNDDFFYNNLAQFPAEQKITLLHRNKKYIFRLTDIMRIWRNSLTHSEELFPDIQDLKNPFTNIIFKKHNLYNIYFKMFFSTFKIPILIQEFFQCQFQKRDFSIKFSIILKDIAIKNYIDNAPQDDLIEDIQEICKQYYSGERDLIFSIKEKDFSRVIERMKVYIHMFLIIEYSQNTKIKNYCKKIFSKEIDEFFKLNQTWFINFFDHSLLIIPDEAKLKKILRKILF